MTGRPDERRIHELPDLLNGGESVHPRHSEIQQNDVRPTAYHHLDNCANRTQASLIAHDAGVVDS